MTSISAVDSELLLARTGHGDAVVDPKELEAFAREHLASYKVPKIYGFRTELPKTPVGKILRKELRREEMEILAALKSS